jgi:hypothetical protein
MNSFVTALLAAGRVGEGSRRINFPDMHTGYVWACSVWITAAAIHREKNTVEAAAAAGLQPQQAAANKLCILKLVRRARGVDTGD